MDGEIVEACSAKQAYVYRRVVLMDASQVAVGGKRQADASRDA
jgi:hypothetical protein